MHLAQVAILFIFCLVDTTVEHTKFFLWQRMTVNKWRYFFQTFSKLNEIEKYKKLVEYGDI